MVLKINIFICMSAYLSLSCSAGIVFRMSQTSTNTANGQTVQQGENHDEVKLVGQKEHAFPNEDNRASQYQEGTVHIASGKASFTPGLMDKSGDAYGFYNNTLMTTGWSVLEIVAGSNEKSPDRDMMYAAGYLEGIFTAEQMWKNYQNVRPFYVKSDDLDKKFRAFLQQQDTWTRNMVTQHPDDPLWKAIGYIMAHLDGLFDGYKSVAEKSWEQTPYIVQFLNGVGDLIDIRNVVDKSSRPNFSIMTPAEIFRYARSTGHCSALVKVLGAYENLYMSHSSWFTYSATMRIYKHYHFNLKDANVAATDMSFSSYPGFLESLDDFYLLSSKMVLLQTTNNVFNTSLYDLVTPESLLAWQRVRLANMLANSGQEWYSLFKRYNSGTYNNQYMVIDLKKVQLGKVIEDGALWVVEQIPTLVEGADESGILRTGYWPSYNVPFFEKIYNMSDYPKIVKDKGLDMSYQLAPRAKIFRRDQASVTDLPSMKAIMRYNDYKDDPYSEGNPCNTICCRGDLDDTMPRADGCYDTKVSDFNMAMNMQASIINGPTRSHKLPAFSWDGIFAEMQHEGLPNVYNFDWQLTEPSL